MSITYTPLKPAAESQALRVTKDGIIIGTITSDKTGKYFIPFEEVFRKQPGFFPDDMEAINEGIKNFNQLIKEK